MDTDRAQRKRPTIATEWQLDVLRNLQSDSPNPTEEQRSAAAAEAGLDEKWVKDWFTRQRSKVVPKRKRRSAGSTHYTTLPTFKLQLQPPPSRSSVSTPADSVPCSSRQPRHSTSPHSMRLHDLSQNPTLVATPTYSRDPLCNRYPDFSQFFHPQVYERFPSPAFPEPIHSYIHPPAGRNMVSYAPMHHHNFYTGNLLAHPNTLAYLRPCPVTFSMRLVDLLGHA